MRQGFVIIGRKEGGFLAERIGWGAALALCKGGQP